MDPVALVVLREALMPSEWSGYGKEVVEPWNYPDPLSE